jgi:hypothetical protein
MTTRRVYSCNLCASGIQDSEHGLGVKWTTNTKLAFVQLIDAESHLCNICLDAVYVSYPAMRHEP